jgi:hypothetical protein
LRLEAEGGRVKGRVSELQVTVLGAPQAMLPSPLFDTGSDLGREIVARPLDHRACQRLEVLGVSGRFVAELNARCLIGAARVHLSPDGARWDPDGPVASRSGAVGGPMAPRLLIGMSEGGELADILAVSTAQPDQVARRTGEGWCLGEDVIRAAEADAWGREKRVMVKLVADPLEWLRAQGRSIWIADWAAALPRLRGLGERVTLECDAGAGARIKALLAIGGLPKVKERAPVARMIVGEAA